MRQIVIPRHGGPDVLRIRSRPDPVAEEGEVTVSVRAAGINFADLLARRGLYPEAPRPPCVVGYEVAGIVDAVGEGVSPDLIGTAVVALTRFGGYSEAVAVPAGQVFAKPDGLSMEEAAGLAVTYLTAYQLLVVMGSLREGESVLIHNAGGGVGLAAIDVGRHVGAVLYGTASPQKHPFLKERGLDHALDYRTRDWTEDLDELTGGRGVELIIDPLGGSHWKKSYRALRSTGRLGMFGISTTTQVGIGRRLRLARMALSMPWFNPLSLMNRNRGVFGVNLGRLWEEPDKVRAWMTAISQGVAEGWARPHVSKAFPFSDAAGAHAYVENRQNTGKVVLVP